MPLPKDDFLQRLAAALETPEPMTEVTILADLKGWDSLGQLATMVLIEDLFKLTLEVDKLRKCRYVRDLIVLLGDRLTQ